MSQVTSQQKIEIPFPSAAEPTLILRTGPCRIHFTVSDGPAWISGTYDDPTGMLPIEVQPGDVTTIGQRFDLTAFSNAVLPRLELAFSRERPFALEIESGATDTTYDLGGMPLTRLGVRAGAGRFDLDFASPNPTTMRSLELSAGAGALSAKRLANAHFASFRLGAGVAGCTLDFGGELTQDASARIDMGLGAVDVFVPAAAAFRVRAKTFAAAVHTGTGFIKQGDVYMTAPAAEGKHPLIDVEASVSFGALNLSST